MYKVTRVMPFYYTDEIIKLQWINGHYENLHVELTGDYLEYRGRVRGLPHRFVYDLGHLSKRYPSVIQYLCGKLGLPAHWYPSLLWHARKYDLLDVGEPTMGYSILAHLAQRHGTPPYIITVSMVKPFLQIWRHYLTKLLAKKVLRDARGIIAITSKAYQRLVVEGLLPADSEIPHVVTGHHVDVTQFYPYSSEHKDTIRANLGLSKDEKILLFVGKLRDYKGLHYLIEALPRVVDRGQNFKLLLVGGADKAYQAYLQALVKKHQLGARVKFWGREPYDELVKFYNVADLFLLPSIRQGIWEEAFGMVLVEAMACGTPVVASAIGGIPDVVRDGKTGFLVPEKDPPALADAIARLLEDDTLRRAMGRESRAWAEQRWDLPVIGRRYAEFYLKCLE